ncbi:MAG TPA: hypothetical protein VMW50_00790 [Dehalococcoidia bacterium]|nr:hypothetical protein [Dehalococcoidia bacterium]
MKKILFLIIGTLLVLGLVLPGCGEPVEPEEVIYTFEDTEIVIGIAGEFDHVTGIFQNLGATVAKGVINGGGGVVIGGVAHNITLQLIDTNEATDETGESGALAMAAAIDDVDFVMGGFRTEAVEYYRDVAMDAEVIFFNCGAATELLQHSVVTDYDTYKYWFKTTPYNEYFLALNVLRNINAVAIQLREALNMTAVAQLDACIVAEDLKWSRDEQVPIIEDGLAALNITLKETYLVSSLDSASTIGALADIAGSYNPHIIIPIYSGAMGVYFAGTLATYAGLDVICPMSVGINVYAQLKAPWTSAPGAQGYHVILDTWASGVAQTSKTAAFLSAFMTYSGGEYPLYTAATYDACFLLQACLEDVGYVEGGVGKAKAEDIIEWLEDPANAIVATTGTNCLFQQPGREVSGVPGLTEAQVREIYPIDTYGYVYDLNDWLMPPNTTHDLCPGPGRATGIGAQWQYTGSAWEKVGVWPVDLDDPSLIDQYGDWNFEFTGTVALQIPASTINHF